MNQWLQQIPLSVLYVLVFLFGLCIGSFLNVCICRLPEGESIVSPGSRCPKCGHCLSWWENVPVVSFLVLRGRCSECGEPISFQYPLVELLTGFISLFLIRRFGLSWPFIVYFCFSCSMIVVTFIDLAHRIIPDAISLPGILAGFACSFLVPEISWTDSLAGILIGGGLLYIVTWGYYLVTKRVGMGGGDIKLLAMIGAFLGWRAIPFVIFISALTGSVIGVIFILIKGAGRNYQIPFGPFLAVAAEIQLFFGEDILSLYHHLFSFQS